MAGAVGFGIFRWLATFIVLVWSVAALSPSLAGVVTAGAVLIDLAGFGLHYQIKLHVADQERHRWLDELTLRLFFESFWDTLKRGDYIDIKGLFAEAARAAAADVKSAFEEIDEARRFFQFSYWRSGVMSFAGHVFGSATFYAVAWMTGEWLKG